MEEHLKRLPPDVSVLVQTARDTAAALDVRAYLVGGFVRDLVMGVANADLDICVEGDGIAFAGEYASRLGAKLTAHPRFGTATVHAASHHKVDVASTRQEVYAAAGALPLVSRAGLRDDLARRDFTINTLAVSLAKDSYGQLIDLFGARADIRAKKVRILHDASFVDDPTRIFRAVRFEQRLDFRIEAHTLRCLKQAVALRVFASVGPQRLRDEVMLMLKEKNPLRQVSRLSALAGLDMIHPGLRLSASNKALLQSLQRQAAWFDAQCGRHRSLDRWLVFFIALLDGLSVEALSRVCDHFVLRTSERLRMLSYAQSHERVIAALRPAQLHPSQVYQLLEPLSLEEIIVLKAKARHRHVEAHIETFLYELHAVRTALTGHQIKELGVAPGPAYQRLLRAVLFAKLDGKVKSKEDEMDFARAWARQHH